LNERAWSVALLESNTAGSIAGRLAAAHGANTVAFAVGDEALPEVVTTTLADLGDAGPSEAAAVDAAVALRLATGTSVAVAVLGTTGEQDGIYGSGEGRTFIGVSTAEGCHALLCPYGGNDEYTVIRIGNQAMGEVWKLLKSV
jgi:nicotinamide mononucleotide (NMN) deamidase PncC